MPLPTVLGETWHQEDSGDLGSHATPQSQVGGTDLELIPDFC